MGLKYHYRRRKKVTTNYLYCYLFSLKAPGQPRNRARTQAFILTRAASSHPHRAPIVAASEHGVGGGAIATSELPLPLASLGQEEDGDGLHCCLDDDGRVDDGGEGALIASHCSTITMDVALAGLGRTSHHRGGPLLLQQPQPRLGEDLPCATPLGEPIM
jgi:hypothetical protein